MMDRAERAGLGAALAGHVALIVWLSLAPPAPPRLPDLANEPIEVTLAGEVAPVASAPDPSPRSAAAPAPAHAAQTAEPEPAPLVQPKPVPPPPAPKAVPPPRLEAKPKPIPKAPPQPAAKPRPVAKAESKPAAKPASRPAPAAKPQRTSGLSRSIVTGLSDAPPSRAATGSGATPAAQAGPAVQSSIAAEVRRQLKPHWKSPSGADVELLRTTLIVELNRDGSLSGEPRLKSQSGVNDSNRSQARLHVDQAIKAVRLAAPFNLPERYYDVWREITPTFDKRLSQ